MKLLFSSTWVLSSKVLSELEWTKLSKLATLMAREKNKDELDSLVKEVRKCSKDSHNKISNNYKIINNGRSP